MHESVRKMWQDYHRSIGIESPAKPVADGFCNNEKDANALADLVARGIKRATASSLWAHQKTGFPLPQVGSAWIVTNWAGEAVCVVKTISVTTQAFREISVAQAKREGEGDGSLEYWRRVHQEFFAAEASGLGFEFSEEMTVVFEEFDRVFP